jgi:hypothetical protein
MRATVVRPSSIAVGLLASLLLSLPASALETIVGRWGETEDVCRSANVIVLAPMRLQSDETVCNFIDVTRLGDVVTWRGSCKAGEEPIHKETVIATLHPNRTLTLLFKGTGAKYPGLIRCR